MEDAKELRAGFPEKAKEHFEGFLKSVKSYPPGKRDTYWWAWVLQFGDELREAEERKLLNEDEAKKIKSDVNEFMNTGENLQEFLTAKPIFEKGDYKHWWENEAEGE